MCLELLLACRLTPGERTHYQARCRPSRCSGSRISGTAKGLFDKSCVATGLRHAERLQIILGSYPLIKFIVIADPVLWRTSSRWQRTGDVVNVGGSGKPSEPAPQPDE